MKIENNTHLCFIDTFANSLDLQAFGFKYSVAKETGRKPYNPQDLLKLYIYGYLIELEHGDQKESSVTEPTAAELEQKIEKLKERKDKYQSYQSEIEQSGKYP